MQELNTEFELDEDLVYLNHAAVAPWPRRTAEAVCAFARENLTRGAQRYPQWTDVEKTLRERLRTLLNAPSTDDIALLKNTSEGLSVVAHGLTWQAGDEIVGIDHEFPSNRVVWESLAARGVNYVKVDVNAAADPEDALIRACDRRTRLLAVSSVHYATGLTLDLERLGGFCRDQGILFCIDAIQSLGAFALDVQRVRADFVAADGHKWLLGPEGIAVFYCRSELRQQLELHQYGWHMLEHPGDFERLTWQPSDKATRFECGSPNMLGIHGLNASLSLLLEASQTFVSKRILHANDYLVSRLKLMPNMEIISHISAERRSGIVTFRHRTVPSETLYRSLMQRNIICAQRGGGIRFSPHFHINDNQLDEALEKLNEIVQLQR